MGVSHGIIQACDEGEEKQFSLIGVFGFIPVEEKLNAQILGDGFRFIKGVPLFLFLPRFDEGKSFFPLGNQRELFFRDKGESSFRSVTKIHLPKPSWTRILALKISFSRM